MFLSCMAVLFLTCPSYIWPSESLLSFMLIFIWMSILWKNWRPAENKYSLIERLLAFSLQCFHVDLCTRSHTVTVFSLPPVKPRSSPRLLQRNRYHLTYMADIFLSFPLTLVPCLPLSYKSSFSGGYPSQSSGLLLLWWQGASLLGRWDSNQSGLPRGASDHRARLPNCPEAGSSAAVTHVHRGTGAAVLAGSSACESLSWTDGGLDGPPYTGHMGRAAAGAEKCWFAVWFWSD